MLVFFQAIFVSVSKDSRKRTGSFKTLNWHATKFIATQTIADQVQLLEASLRALNSLQTLLLAKAGTNVARERLIRAGTIPHI